MKPPLTSDQQRQLATKITGLEQLTCAPFRIVLTGSSWLGLRNKARRLFSRCGLDQNPQHNGVLVLVDYKNHELLVYGDEAIHARLGQRFWDDITCTMTDEISRHGLYAGLNTGLHLLGDSLAAMYPADADASDRIANELVHDA